jgi:hypothetical protein
MDWKENKLVGIAAVVLAVIALLAVVVPIIQRRGREDKELREGYEQFKARHQFDAQGNPIGPKQE